MSDTFELDSLFWLLASSEKIARTLMQVTFPPHKEKSCWLLPIYKNVLEKWQFLLDPLL